MENNNRILESENEYDETIEIDTIDEYENDDEITVEFDDNADDGLIRKVNKASGFPRSIVQIVSAAVIVVCVIVNIAVSGDTDNSQTIEPVPEPTPPLLSIGLDSETLSEIDPLFVSQPAWSVWGDYSVERNDDLVAWIQLGDTIVDYPVVQKTWSQYAESGYEGWYYLYRDFDRVFRYGSRGTLFVDRHTPIVDSRRPDNTVIYGHNMIAGTKFAYLVNYYQNFYYVYRKDPTIQFVTIYDEKDDVRNTYKIFAGMLVNTQDKDGMVFDYFRRWNFNDDGRWGNSHDEFFDFIGNVMDRSNFYTEVDLRYGDEILTMSTCLWPLGRDNVDSRYALFARRVRPGEDPTVDVDAAWINPSPLYFDAWYRIRGGSWRGRSWDTSLVEGFDEWLAANPDWCSTQPRQLG
jgi:sortase B